MPRSSSSTRQPIRVRIGARDTSTKAPSTTGTLSLRSWPDTSCQFAHNAITQAATMTT